MYDFTTTPHSRSDSTSGRAADRPLQPVIRQHILRLFSTQSRQSGAADSVAVERLSAPGIAIATAATTPHRAAPSTRL